MPKRYMGLSPEQQMAQIKASLIALPTRVANLGLKHFKRNFEEAGWEGNKWVKRQDTLNHPLLQKTRTLYRALKKDVQANRVRVFVAAPADTYGAAHNNGFKGPVRVTRNGNSHIRQANLPQRKFIGKSIRLDMEATKLITDTLHKILKP